jgi:hypothetical protein
MLIVDEAHHGHGLATEDTSQTTSWVETLLRVAIDTTGKYVHVVGTSAIPPGRHQRDSRFYALYGNEAIVQVPLARVQAAGRLKPLKVEVEILPQHAALLPGNGAAAKQTCLIETLIFEKVWNWFREKVIRPGTVAEGLTLAFVGSIRDAEYLAQLLQQRRDSEIKSTSDQTLSDIGIEAYTSNTTADKEKQILGGLGQKIHLLTVVNKMTEGFDFADLRALAFVGRCAVDERAMQQSLGRGSRKGHPVAGSSTSSMPGFCVVYQLLTPLRHDLNKCAACGGFIRNHIRANEVNHARFGGEL